MMDALRQSCAFTGHRPASYPWKYDEQAEACKKLKAVLFSQIKALAEAGVTHFLSGMAQGADLWAAQAVLTLREANPALNLHCILPCEGQADKWPPRVPTALPLHPGALQLHRVHQPRLLQRLYAEA